MSKWAGKIGYSLTNEFTSEPGVWKEEIVEKNYCGDLLQNTRQLQNPGQANDNVNVSNKISIVADPFVSENFHRIRYITFMGSQWKVSNVDVQYPRLILSIGGLYNEH